MFNILIAEDDKNLRKLITTYLKKNNYNTFEAINGEEALNVLDENYIDLIISDLMKYKISIIIPIFNVEDYLRNALNSILHQTME